MSTDWIKLARASREYRDAEELKQRDALAGVEIIAADGLLTIRAQSRVETGGACAGTWRTAVYEYSLAMLRGYPSPADELIAFDLRSSVLAVQPRAREWITDRLQDALEGAEGIARWPDPTL